MVIFWWYLKGLSTKIECDPRFRKLTIIVNLCLSKVDGYILFFIWKFKIVNSCFTLHSWADCFKVRQVDIGKEGGAVWKKVKVIVTFIVHILVTLNCTAYAKWVIENLKATSGGIFHSSLVLTADQVKNRYHCAWLVYLSRVILLCSFFQLRCLARISWRWSSWLLFKSYVSLLPYRISYEQLYAALFRTVQSGAAMRGPIPAASRKQLKYDEFVVNLLWSAFN